MWERPDILVVAAGSSSSICFVDEDASNATYWTPGDIWNYLRGLYVTDPPKTDGVPDLVSFNKLLDWPAAASGGFGAELFEVQGNVNPNFDIDSGGLHLAHAVDVAVRKRSDLDWTVTYDGTTGKAKMAIIGVGTATIDTAQRRLCLKRGEIGNSVTEAQAEVVGGNLTYSAAETRTRVRGMGAAKLYDLTFDTVAGTLAADWLVVDQTDWHDNYFDSSDDDADAIYPAVYLRFVVPDSFDWTSVGWPISVLKRRPTQAELQSFIGTDAQHKVRMQVWRSTDTSAPYTWAPCPEGIHPVVLHDRLGVLFPESAREISTHGDDEADEETYTWDEDSQNAYEFRITVSVEAEEHLTAMDQVSDDFPPNWPVLETMVVEDNWGYAARVDAFLRVDADGVPAEDSLTTGTLGSASAPDIIRNDGAVIGTTETGAINSGMPVALANIRSRLCRTAFTGSVILKGLRVDIKPGDYLWRLKGGGSEGTRPDIDIDAVIGSVAYEFTPETQTTTLELRAGE